MKNNDLQNTTQKTNLLKRTSQKGGDAPYVYMYMVDLNTDCTLSNDFDFVWSSAISGFCNR